MASGSAKVTSIDAIRRFQAALASFEFQASDALAALELEIGRVVDWVEHDRPAYWKGQVRDGWNRVAEARSNLERCEMGGVEGHQPACRDEREALYRAKSALHRAEEKVEAARAWTRAMRHEVSEYQGRLVQMTSWIEGEYPRAAAALGKIIKSLDAYAAIAVAGEESDAAFSGTADEEDPPHELSRLRQRTPDAFAREGRIAAAEASQEQSTGLIDLPRDATLDRLELCGEAPSAEQLVVIDQAALSATRVYLERNQPTGDDDSGWFLGQVDRASGEQSGDDAIVAMSIRQLLDARLELGRFLNVTPGHLVVIDGETIEAVLDRAGRDVWDAGARETAEE